MKNRIKILGLFITLLAFLNTSYAQDKKINVEDWPETAKMAAKAMMDKYGEPHEHTESMLIWNDTEPFIKTIVYKEEIQHDFPMPHKDVLEQVINHDAPIDKYSDLARFDGSVIVERTKGTIAARCDKEAANLLALNLAHDIIENKKTVEEAKQFYADTMMGMMQGEEHEYLKELSFDIVKRNITNPGETIMDMSKVKEMKEKQNKMNK
ncbi:hypothetical protein LB467_18210 [Salegentibacter sp. JZCK2]|uniref:hypothetical protein n=1 Tax=Salegentibacter tibetensis TaxID=2873600 RepID=UPI001CCC7F0C|nr:hypothetical protein [Salegentibacter tibetensis]MBZ9731625.1 hypothetical protein [Salegentibacter tibetensis]